VKRIASAALLAILGVTVHAHHSHPDFLENQRVAVEGTIEFLQYVNPHSQMLLRTKDGVLYTIELPGAYQLRLPGTNCAEPIYSETLTVGDRLVVTGIPPVDPLRHELLMRNMFRPSDGWERFHEGLHCRN
jgi:Family of unknown function (DUF6152)